MTEILDHVRALVAAGEVRVSLHGYEELAADNVPVRDIIDGLTSAEAIEEYPSYQGALRLGSGTRQVQSAGSCCLGDLRGKVDENMPAEAATVLREAGWECDTVFDEALAGAEDPRVIGRCRIEGRVGAEPPCLLGVPNCD